MASKRDTSQRAQPDHAGNSMAKRLPPVVLAWLIPGAGHYYFKRRVHGLILLGTVVGMFACGLLMQGRMFSPISGDLFTTIMNYGGYFGDLCNGSLYFLTKWSGYEQGVLPGAIHDYGTKFMVCSGLLNLLAVVDVYEIAAGRKR